LSVGDDDQRVDLEVGKLAVDVDSIQSRDEVNQDIVDTLRDLLQESCSKLLVGGVLGKVNWNENLLGFGIDITDIDTTLVCEENPIALTGKNNISTWHARSRQFDWRRIDDGVGKESRLARAKGADSGNDPAHADAGPKLHVDSMRFGRVVGLLRCDP
jgi:hypothetical protein